MPDNSNQKYCLNCKPTVLKEWYRRNGALYRQRHPERVREQQRKAVEKRRDHYLAMDAFYHSRIGEQVKQKVFDHYSNGTLTCACCGESEIDFLTIDHINNDGAKHRLELSGRRNWGGVSLYKWLVRNGFPPGFAVLCMNSNLSKGKHGMCIHHTARVTIRSADCHY